MGHTYEVLIRQELGERCTNSLELTEEVSRVLQTRRTLTLAVSATERERQRTQELCDVRSVERVEQRAEGVQTERTHHCASALGNHCSLQTREL
jgi:hypothetical protein